jgi:hypothetical protein
MTDTFDLRNAAISDQPSWVSGEDRRPASTSADDADCRISSQRENVLRHAFLSELLRCLWRQGRRRVEHLQAVVDCGGYDVVLDWNGIVRHVQLKATFRGSKVRDVTINRNLQKKPSGCVVWIEFERDTLELDAFYWLGGAPGQPLTELGDKIGRHTKGNGLGKKTERREMREVAKSRFRKLIRIEEVAAALFGEVDSTETVDLREGAHRDLLIRHLRRRSRASQPNPEDQRRWAGAVRQGNFNAIPETLDWESSASFAHLIDGYLLAPRAGLGDVKDFVRATCDEAARTGRWRGTALELWVTLFIEHRRIRHGGYEPGDEERRRLDGVCRALRDRLIG